MKETNEWYQIELDTTKYTPVCAFTFHVPGGMSRSHSTETYVEYVPDPADPEKTIYYVWLTSHRNNLRLFKYEDNAVNDKFLLGQEEDDFILDGYCIRKISHLNKVEIKDDLCNAINKFNGTHEKVKMPPVDISSWQSIFDSLKVIGCFVIIENEIEGRFLIGVVEKTFKNKLYFRSFDADGIWDDGWEINYRGITTIKWGCRYAENWQKYLNRK